MLTLNEQPYIKLFSSLSGSTLVRCIHRPLKIKTDSSHARVCKLGSISVFGFYCNFVNFNFVPLGYGELLAKTTLEPKLVGAGLEEHPPKIGSPYLFLQPLKIETSNLVHNMGLGSSIPRNNV